MYQGKEGESGPQAGGNTGQQQQSGPVPGVD
jgi:hypothetical protein